MRITPTQTSFAPKGPPPSFRIETDSGYPYYAVQVTTAAVLFNGANAGSRAPANFFDSWLGDKLYKGRQVKREVGGMHLEALSGQATYTLPPLVWSRMQWGSQLFFRLIISRNDSLPGDAKAVHKKLTLFSVSDLDWARAPSISLSSLPARPARSPVARFRGTGVLSRKDLPAQAKQQMGDAGIIQGRDKDFRFVLLDARYFHMTVLECHEWGLTDTVDKMPRKPDAIINGQFLSGAVSIDTEGQVIREGRLIHADSQATRYYVAQTWRGTEVDDYRMGKGNPKTEEPDARVAFGGLGPVLKGGAAVGSLTPWAKSVYDKPAKTGRGVIAIERNLGLILLIVQEDYTFEFMSTNPLKMGELRDRLRDMGFDDAVFNDGSDSESLYAGGGWLLTPATVKDEAMDFAISFVDRRFNSRMRVLAIDGTKTGDAQTFVEGVSRPPLTHYAPRNITDDLQSLPALSSIAGTFKDGIIRAWGTKTQAQADQVSELMEQAGKGGHWADILYISSHAQRHGQLYYHDDDDDNKPTRFIAPLWSSSFKPSWKTTPRWLILAGCAVLSLRYTRGRVLTTTERNHLVTWHHNMHGAAATVPGLTPQKKTIFPIYHPGWAWYDRVFRHSPSIRGVLGYWYRSPGGVVGDVGIMQTLTKELREGKTFLQAWESANSFYWGLRQAAWAAMIRENCEKDTLATLENPDLPAASSSFKYYDQFQQGKTLPDAYKAANLLNDSTKIGSVSVTYNKDYDRFAIDELKALSGSPTPANFLQYNDGIGPKK